jgi:hypothetical protein
MNETICMFDGIIIGITTTIVLEIIFLFLISWAFVKHWKNN